MSRFFLLLLIIPPIVEIVLLIVVGQYIGVWPTLLLIVLTGILGVWFAKREGLQALRLARLQLQKGQIPDQVLLDGICIIIGGLA